MDATYEDRGNKELYDEFYASVLNAWFAVSGDTDDFIFYGEPDRARSEK